jgi:hypothetical protein
MSLASQLGSLQMTITHDHPYTEHMTISPCICTFVEQASRRSTRVSSTQIKVPFQYTTTISFTRFSPLISLYRNHLNSCTPGPSLNNSVDTSLAPSTTPCLAFLLLLSHTIQLPNNPAVTAPVAPNAAVVTSAGIYLGISCVRKMFELTTPIRFASGTPTLVSVTRLFSSATLLLYQVDSSTDGADVPHVIMKHAKYAT